MGVQGVGGMSGGTFRRLTGVSKRTFSEMVAVLEKAEACRKAQAVKPNHLAVPTRLLMTHYTRTGRTLPTRRMLH